MSGTKLRIRFSKLGKVRWTSHRDVARMWERAFRRVQLPLAYSEGFSPRPKVAFGLALPTGHESLAEYLDVELAAGAEVPDGLLARLSDALPSGVDATGLVEIPPGTPSLQESVTSCDWRWRVVVVGPAGDAVADAGVAPAPSGVAPVPSGVAPVPVEWLAGQAAALLAAPELVITRQRKGREVREDIRPSILHLHVTEDGWIEAELAARPRSIRPADVIAAFERLPDTIEQLDVRRRTQWISRDGARREPVELSTDATNAPHAWERAS